METMRQLILVGILSFAGFTMLACGGIFLLAVLVFSTSGQSSYSAGYDPAFGPVQPYPIDDFQPVGISPVHQPAADGQWNGPFISHGTVDSTGQGGDIYTLDGEVLNRPN
jgi:hypothetical protein